MLACCLQVDLVSARGAVVAFLLPELEVEAQQSWDLGRMAQIIGAVSS